MTVGERLVGLLHGTFFLRPLVLVVLYPMLVYMLVANVQPGFFHRYTFYALFGVAMVFFFADRFRQLYYLDRRRETGVHWRSLVLQYAKWPYFAHAVWQAVTGWRGAFTVTPKTGKRSLGGSIVVPHVMLALLMTAALGTRIAMHGVPRPALLGVALGFIGLSLLLASTEAIKAPPQFDAALYARRRALLEDLIGPR